MQRRDMKSLKQETKIPETIQSESRKIQKKKKEQNLWNKNKNLAFVSLESQK